MMDQQFSANAVQEPSQPPGDPWRNELQARLERYKRRRGRRIEGAFTMRFPFPPDEPAAEASSIGTAVADGELIDEPIEVEEPTIAGSRDANDAAPVMEALIIEEPIIAIQPAKVPAVAASLDCDVAPIVREPGIPESPAIVMAPEVDPETVPAIREQPRPRPRRKVIAFPGPFYGTREGNRSLADPVEDKQLRILDVPEELQAIPATPFLDGLLDAVPEIAPPVSQAMNPELPHVAMGAGARLLAAAIDITIALLGIAAFAGVAYRFLPQIVPGKSLIVGGAATAVLLWAVYQYLFVVYSGRTLGMRAARVRLTTFKGRVPDFRRRQLRVLGLYLSVLSLGMGVLWYFVDVDSLCWHDRISQTFPVPAKRL